jgi:tetratricopeptide (TPR) repeat protein
MQLSRGERDTAVVQGLGSLENCLASGFDDLRYELHDVSAGIEGVRADFHILMGDIVWKLEIQTTVLNSILRTLQAPLDTASKELRARAEDAYRIGWYEESLADFLQSEQKNYQDFSVHRSIGNIYLYHIVDLPKAVEYFQKATKYAKPRDSKQAAEAEFFAGVACGLQQDYESALKHMQEATSVNENFFEAHICALVSQAYLATRTPLSQAPNKRFTGTPATTGAADRIAVSTKFGSRLIVCWHAS